MSFLFGRTDPAERKFNQNHKVLSNHIDEAGKYINFHPNVKEIRNEANSKLKVRAVTGWIYGINHVEFDKKSGAKPFSRTSMSYALDAMDIENTRLKQLVNDFKNDKNLDLRPEDRRTLEQNVGNLLAYSTKILECYSAVAKTYRVANKDVNRATIPMLEQKVEEYRRVVEELEALKLSFNPPPAIPKQAPPPPKSAQPSAQPAAHPAVEPSRANRPPPPSFTPAGGAPAAAPKSAPPAQPATQPSAQPASVASQAQKATVHGDNNLIRSIRVNAGLSKEYFDEHVLITYGKNPDVLELSAVGDFPKQQFNTQSKRYIYKGMLSEEPITARQAAIADRTEKTRQEQLKKKVIE